MTQLTLYPCPCCGFLVFNRPPGTFEFCPICAWQDDLSQLRFVTTSGGANEESLVEAQKNYLAYGAIKKGRQPRDPSLLLRAGRDEGWRPVDFAVDNIEIPDGKDQGNTYPQDRTSLYYWRGTYWRR